MCTHGSAQPGSLCRHCVPNITLHCIYATLHCITAHHICIAPASHLHCINIAPSLRCHTSCSHHYFPHFCITQHSMPRIEPLGSAYCLRWYPQQRNTLCSLPAQHDAHGSARPGSLSWHYVLSTACTTPTLHTQHLHRLRLELQDSANSAPIT